MLANVTKQIARHALRIAGLPVMALQKSRRQKHDLQRPLTRPQFVAQIQQRPALEIGPFDIPQLAGNDVSFFDVLDQECLRQRARDLGRNVGGCPLIEFVSPTGDMSIIDRRFSAIFSSHAIEHQPDLIRHLNDVEGLLEPGGRFFLIVPDKRFSFDYFLPVTEFSGVEIAHVEGRRLHTEAAIRDHYLGTTHNDPIRHWFGIHGRVDGSSGMREKVETACERARSGEYIDVHAWVFTPESFAVLIRNLRAKGLIGLELERVNDTRFGGLEFFAILRKPA